MKKIIFLIKILFIYFFLLSNGFTDKLVDFEKGKKFFDNQKFEESKIFFERDIVFNPKNERSYLYLAKIFRKKDNDLEQKTNLDTVLLLNPKNDEALYLLILLKIKQSNYDDAKKLIMNFDLVCKSFCSKKKEIQEKFEKLNPEKIDAKN